MKVNFLFSSTILAARIYLRIQAHIITLQIRSSSHLKIAKWSCGIYKP